MADVELDVLHIAGRSATSYNPSAHPHHKGNEISTTPGSGDCSRPSHGSSSTQAPGLEKTRPKHKDRPKFYADLKHSQLLRPLRLLSQHCFLVVRSMRAVPLVQSVAVLVKVDQGLSSKDDVETKLGTSAA